MGAIEGISTRVLLVIVGCVGLIATFYPDTWFPWDFKQFPDIIHSIAHALIIAAILGFTVDKITKDRLVQEAARDLIEYLIGWKLPKESQRHIRGVVLSDVVRYNFEMRCVLTPLEGGRMQANLEVSYFLRNFSIYPRKYTPYIGHEDNENPTFHSIAVHRGPHTKYFYTSYGCGSPLVIYKPGKGYQHMRGDELTINPSPECEEVEPYRVIAKYSLLFRDDYFFVEPLASPTIHVMLHVNRPKGYEVRIACSKVDRESREEYCDIPELFVHGEYLGIRWFPESQPTSSTSSSNDQT